MGSSSNEISKLMNGRLHKSIVEFMDIHPQGYEAGFVLSTV